MSGPWGHHAAHLLMLLLTAAAAVTDLRQGLIPNRLLRRGLLGLAGLAALIALSTLGAWPLGPALPGDVPPLDAALAVLTNALFGLVLSMALYGVGLWAAGDAKLAIVLALAQPAWIRLGGPVPWAPFAVLLGNTFAAAALIVLAELLIRRAPEALRRLRTLASRSGPPRPAGSLAEGARIALATAALVTALSPLRQLTGQWSAEHVSGGYFLALLLISVAYRPLKRVVHSRVGLAALAAALAASCLFVALDSGPPGLLGLGRTLLFSLAVTTSFSLIGGATRPLDSRAVGPAGLEPGMVLADEFVDLLDRERRWIEAFAPVLGSLRAVKLDDNLIKNLREWQAHNAPDQDFLIKTSIPFAPAFVLGLVLTVGLGRLAFTL